MERKTERHLISQFFFTYSTNKDLSKECKLLWEDNFRVMRYISYKKYEFQTHRRWRQRYCRVKRSSIDTGLLKSSKDGSRENCIAYGKNGKELLQHSIHVTSGSRIFETHKARPVTDTIDIRTLLVVLATVIETRVYKGLMIIGFPVNYASTRCNDGTNSGSGGGI